MSAAPIDPPATAAPTTGPALQGDMLFVACGKLLYLATRLAVPPLVLGHVDLAAYGLWTTCFVLVSYIGVSASGFAAVYVRYVAQYRARGELEAINRLLSTGIAAMGLIAALILALLWAAMPSLLELFHVPDELRQPAGWLWLGASAIFLLDNSLGAFGYVLHGLQHIRREQQIWIAAYTLETLAIALFLHLGMGVYGLLAAFGLRYLFSIAASAWSVARALPSLRLGWRHLDRRCLRIFFGFGSWVQLGGLASTLLHSADKMIAGLSLGPAAAALMDLAGKLPSTGASLASSASMVALPAAAGHAATGAHDRLLAVYGNALRMTAWMAGLMLPPLACLAPRIVTAWLGPRADAATLAAIMAWVAMGMHLHILTGPASAMFRGMGRIGNEYIYHGLRLAGLLVVLTAIWLAGPLAPAPLAAALGCSALTAATLYILISHRGLTGGWRGIGRAYLLPCALPYGAAWLAARAADLWPLPVEAGRAETLAHLLPALALYAVFALTAAWRLALSPAQRQAARARLLLPRSASGRSSPGASTSS